MIPGEVDEGWQQHGWDVLRDAYVSQFGQLIRATTIFSPDDLARDLVHLQRPDWLPGPYEEVAYMLTFAPRGRTADRSRSRGLPARRVSERSSMPCC